MWAKEERRDQAAAALPLNPIQPFDLPIHEVVTG
jgi:hypothetical protein